MNLALLLTLVLAMLMIVSPTFADTIVIPKELTNSDGNAQGGFSNGERIQQVYSKDLFTVARSPFLEITEIRFRVDPNAPAFSNNPDLEVRLSTTSQDPNNLNSSFALNTGSDEIIVLPRTRISWSGNPGLSFDVVIPLPNHFVYAPANGSLLLDIKMYDRGADPTSFDVQSVNGDGLFVTAGTITNPIGLRDTSGFVMQFGFTAIPEPRAMHLVILSLVMMIIRSTWRKYVAP